MGLRKLRHRRGLTQTELAEHIGMKQPSLSQYERGVRNIHLMSLDNAVKLCEILECTPQELLEPDD